MAIRDATRTDVLSDVIGLLEPRSEVVCRSRFTAPWGLAFSRMAAHFHVVERGSCFFRVEGEPVVVAGPGDLVVLPRGVRYEISDTARRRTVAYERVVGSSLEHASRLLDYGGGGTETAMLCAISRLRFPAAAPMLAALPAAIVVRREGHGSQWLDMTTSMLLHEAASVLPGSDLSTSRLLDLLFVQAVRAWLDALPARARPFGWLGALRDPRIGRALGMLHGSPAHRWTVAELARRAGSSKSAFATKFTTLVGEPPLRYLARWRLMLASRALVRTGDGIREIASSVGYDAEEAFSRAFKREFGVAPSVYRAKPQLLETRQANSERREES